jgi:pilus assembly protein CpaC
LIAAQPISTSNTASSGTAAQASTSSSTSTYSADSGPGIVNLLNISGEEQVAVKVTVAEMQRSVAKQLGVNISGSYTTPDFSIKSPTGLSPIGAGVGANFQPGNVGISFTSGDFDIQATIRALDETSMIRTLAEPTLTAVSGETADFLAGGEVPFITGVDANTGTASVAFKRFGVQLAFTPVVLSPGRISLRVRTEVSDIAGFSSTGNPILATRSAETTVEQPSGVLCDRRLAAAEHAARGRWIPRAAQPADPRSAVLVEELHQRRDRVGDDRHALHSEADLAAGARASRRQPDAEQ